MMAYQLFWIFLIANFANIAICLQEDILKEEISTLQLKI